MEEDELLHFLNKTKLRTKIRAFLLILVLLGIFDTSTTYADANIYKNYHEIVKQNQQKTDSEQEIYKPLIEENKKQVLKLESEHRKLVKQAGQAFKDHANDMYGKWGEGCVLEQVIENIKNLELEEKKSKHQGILVFISFSMPKELLWSYQEQAKLYGARLVIRGLIDNDFKKTVQAMDLGNDRIMNLDVNPVLFKDYGIEKVPSIVIAGDRDEENKNPADKFTGTIGLTYALEESISKGHQKLFSDKKLKAVKDRE